MRMPILSAFAVFALAATATFAQTTAPASQPTKEYRTEIESDRTPTFRTGGNVLIKNITALTASHGTIENCSILVRNGKIAAMGTSVAGDEGVTVIDGTGMYAMPGIVDCHAHIAITGGVNEGTTSISAEVRIADVIDPTDIDIYRALAGGTTTSHLLHGSANVIGGQDAVVKLKWGTSAAAMRIPDAPQGIKFALGENPKRSAGRYPNTRLGIEALLRRAFTEAKEYQSAMERWAAAVAAGDRTAEEPRRDLRMEALVKILKGEIIVHSHCYRADEILMLMKVAEDFGFRIATLQHVLEGFKIGPEIAAHGAAGSTFSDWWAYKIEAYDATPYNAALMWMAGVNMSMNSDSEELDRRLYLEAAKAVKYGGVPEEEALKMITLNPAQQLRIAHRTGSLDIGKDGDIAIFDGHPMSVYSKCMTTLIEGEVYFTRKKDAAVEVKSTVPFVAPWKSEIPVSASDHGLVRAIKGATIHPVSREKIENGTIVWQEGRILAVGGPLTPIPAGAEVIDGRGHSIYPGMIDAGTTLAINEIGSITETQDTDELGRIQPDLLAATGVNPESEHIPVARVNGITAAVISPNGGVISGQSSLLTMDGWTTRELTLVDGLALTLNFPSSRARPFGEEDHDHDCGCDDLMSGAPPFEPDPPAPAPAAESGRESEALKAIKDVLKEARDYDRRVREAAERKSAPPKTDLRLAALVAYAAGRKPIIVDVTSKDDIKAAIKFAEDEKLKIILRGAAEAWKIADFIAEKNVPVILGPVFAVPRDVYDPYDSQFTAAAELHRAGVRFCLQTAAASDVRNLPYQAGMAASYGLPRETALRAVTLSTAEILGVGHVLGSLDPGKRADFVVTDGDLLEIRTHVHRLVIGGKDVSLETRHTRFFEKYRKRLAK